MKGFVYILINKAFPGLVKIGFTYEKPKDRAKQLSTTGVPHSFKVFGFVEVIDPEGVERLTHSKLKKYRELKKREFFRIKAETALETLEAVSGEFEAREEVSDGVESQRSEELEFHYFMLMKNERRMELNKERSGRKYSDANTEAEKALLNAVSAGNFESVKQHLIAGANVNAVPASMGPNALEIAASLGHKEIVELLINNGANVLLSCPIFYALGGGGKDENIFEIIKIVIAEGASLHAIDLYKEQRMHTRTLLDVAIQHSRWPAAKLLFEKGIKSRELTIEEVKDLLEGKIDTSIRNAIRDGDIKELKRLLTYAHSTSYGWPQSSIVSGTYLDEAMRNSLKPDIVYLLRQFGHKTAEELKAEGE